MIVYKITNQVNQKIYIGMTTKTLEERWKGHLRCYKQTEYAFHRALRKYGIQNFTKKQLDTANTLDELIQKETCYIDKFDSMNPKKGYNMIRQDTHLKILNDDVKKKIGISQRIRESKMSKEDKQKRSENNTQTYQGRKTKRIQQFVGVTRIKNLNTYRMWIGHNKKFYYKRFKTATEAAVAYDIWALYLYGSNAKLNFSKDDYVDINLKNYITAFQNTKQPSGQPKKLNQEQIKQILMLNGKTPHSKIALQFKVSQSLISAIIRQDSKMCSRAYLLKDEE